MQNIKGDTMHNKIKTFSSNVKIKNKLILSYLFVAIATVTIVSMYLTVRMNDIVVNNAITEGENNANTMQYRVTQILNLAIKVSDMIYADEDLNSVLTKQYADDNDVINNYENYEHIDAYLKYYDELANITVYVNNVTLLSNSNITIVNDNISKQNWYKKAVAGRGKIFWRYGVRDNDGTEFLSLIRAIYENNKLVGVLVIDINYNYLSAILDNNPNNIMALDNCTISLDNNINFTRYLSENIIKKSKYKDGYVARNKLNGIDNYIIVNSFSINKSLMNKMQIITMLPVREITRQTNNIILSGISIACMTIIISLIIIIFFSRSISYRISLLGEEMHRVVKGDLYISDRIYGKDEIGQLYEDLKYMISSIKNLIDQVYVQKIQEEELKASQREIEFKMLSSQINPHFLYNTLETIRMKAFLSGDRETANIIKKLGKIMRRNLEVSGKPVTLKSELDLIEGYLQIQSVRFEGMVKYEIKIDRDINVDKYMILPLLLQPIVENAFIHGLEEKKEKGMITLNINIENNDLVINVKDNGIGIEKDKLSNLIESLNKVDCDNKNIGIVNVNQRIKIYYGDKYGITIQSKVKIGTLVKIHLPLERGIKC